MTRKKSSNSVWPTFDQWITGISIALVIVCALYVLRLLGF